MSPKKMMSLKIKFRLLDSREFLQKITCKKEYIFCYCSDCEPCTKLDELRTAAVLADVYDRELVLTIGWAKQVIQV